MTREALVGSNVRLFKCRKFAVLLPLFAFLMAFSLHVTANNLFDRDIRGKIVNKSGEPLAGASVTVKGTTHGTTTNAQGEFVLTNVPDNATIVFSNVGYQPQEVKLTAGKTVFSIQLEDAGQMEDVVVTGFQRINKKNFTGASVRLRAEDVKMDGVADVSRMLEGRAAGVSVQNVSGTFGAAPKVRVRGATSINGDNKPLWVIDGVVQEDIINISNEQLSSGDPTTLLGSAVAGLNANDIESFDILKDAAAAALYGARAMNGVVVITTKKGRAGRTNVNYIGNFSTQLKPTYNEFNIMNSAEQMSVLAELERKGLLTSDVASRADAGVYGKMYDLITTYNPNTGTFGLENTQQAREAYLKKYASVNTDWFDLLFKNSFVQEHALSISGGTDKSQTYFSVSYYGDNGWTIADKVRRYTMNFRNTYNFSDKLSVGFLTAGSVRQQTAPGALSRTSNPVEGTYDRDFDINPFSYSLNTSRTMTAYNDSGRLDYFRRNYAPFNIIEELQNNTLSINVLDVKLQGDLTYKFNKNLRYEFIGAIRYVKSTREHEIKESSNMANAYRAAGNSTVRENNKFLYRDPDNPGSEPIVVLPFGGFYNRQEDQLMNYDIRNSLNYTNTFGDDHALNVLVGQQIKYADRQNFNNTGYGFQYNNGGTPFIDYRILKQTIENNFNYYDMGKDYDRFAAFYSTANYTYKGRYNITGTARYDGSNRLGESKKARWLPTWSIGGSWNIEGEQFMEDVSFIDYATLRATYGLTGSMGPATNSSIVLENEVSNRPYLAEKESVIRLIALENSELTWEKQYTTNLGLDIGFYQRRLTFSMDVYQRKSFDLISIVKTSGIGGELEKVANYADLHSRGIELMLTGEIIRTNNFGWRSNINFGYNYNEIANAQNRPNIFDLVKAEGGNINGYPVNSLFSLSFQGLDHHTGIPTFIDERGNKSQDVYLQDDSTQYLVYSGPVDPPFTGGFSNTFRYKALSLNIFITYQAGNKIRLYPAFNTNYSDLDAMPREFVDRWVFPGDETKTIIPSIVDAFAQNALGSAYPFNNYNYSTARVADGGFVRLKTVSLSYQLPRSLIQKAKLNSFSVTAAATNPWLIYSDPKLKGQDPEFFNTGGVAQPVQKMFTLSLKVGI